MKAFHFKLTTGERGTLAGCADDMTPEQARDLCTFQFPGRLESIHETPSRVLDRFYGGWQRRSQAGVPMPGPMLILQGM